MMDKLFNTDKPLFVSLVGKSCKGKSYFVRYLLDYLFHESNFKFGLVFVRTKYDNDYDFIPGNRVIPGYNEEILKKYISNLENIKKEKNTIEKNVIVLDDLTGVLSNRTPWFINFVATCRHLNTSVIITSQYLNQAISPIIREQTTHAVLFNSRTAKTLHNLYEAWGNLFDTYEDWKRYFIEATRPEYSAILYRESDDDVESNYTVIRAPKNFKPRPVKF